jgi:hypothetical protein
VPAVLDLLTPITFRDEIFESGITCGVQTNGMEHCPGYAARTLKEWKAESIKQ